MDATAAFSPVVIAPTYNNAGTLCDIVSRIESVGLDILVVNDGSTDNTAVILAEWCASPRATTVTIVTHRENRGKAAALQSGFEAAGAAGYTHAVTIDTDGQLDPGQIPDLLAVAKSSPDSLVLGSRDVDSAVSPRANRVAWKLSTLGIWLETGLHIRDSQCGLRVYPLSLIDTVRCRGRRFGFESEIVARAVWAGCSIEAVPVSCRYFPPDQRVSHFNPWRDGPFNFLMHAGLTIRRLIPWPPARMPTPPASDPRPKRHPYGGLHWVSPLQLWRQLRRDRTQQLIIAGSFGIGTYMANVPLGGFQILLAVYAAKRLHVHLLPVLVGLLVMIPPVGVFLAKVAIGSGFLLLHASWPDFTGLDPAIAGHWTVLGHVPIAWPLGSVFVSFVCNWITVGMLLPIFGLIPVRTTRSTGGHESCEDRSTQKT